MHGRSRGWPDQRWIVVVWLGVGAPGQEDGTTEFAVGRRPRLMRLKKDRININVRK